MSCSIHSPSIKDGETEDGDCELCCVSIPAATHLPSYYSTNPPIDALVSSIHAVSAQGMQGQQPAPDKRSPDASRRRFWCRPLHVLLRCFPPITSIRDAVIGVLARRFGECCHPPAVSGRRVVWCTGRLSPSAVQCPLFSEWHLSSSITHALPSHASLSNIEQRLELV
ncbi:hypothetical protein P171DRAFT_124094 [Karstenula rhodostoma CBS 690.94]|uniref:Uncharacterized protein n=1 Tax=Karstenula rhodostoma CBS 690.94 TaxID=1392251 RepID=A0A9P4U5Y0_9PLEO|nr:hypothetical protein P171DRAFT_124094 [Karstenula rhodostoma CBS 690.94]